MKILVHFLKYLLDFNHAQIFNTEQRDTQIREHLSKIGSLEESYQDLEGTVTQFRELVLQLQTYGFSFSALQCDLTVLAVNSIISVHKLKLPRTSPLQLPLKLLP